MKTESALALIDSVKDSKVLFVGDTIIDEYHYVTPLGKAAKEHLIPVRFKSLDHFDGGVDAAAAHARSFCKQVDIYSEGPAIRKARFVDQNYLRKMFEVHYLDGRGGRRWGDMDGYDCVVVTDFGHGEIKDVNAFQDAEYLAVSAQTNSANLGFNLITKYPAVDYIVIDEPEARLAAHDRDSPIEEVMHQLCLGRCEKMIVTHGLHGAYGLHQGNFVHMPTFKERPIDTMGAGDAFFAVTAPMSKHGTIEDLLLIGNAAATLKIQIIGHRASVTKTDLIAFLKAHE